ncbi:MAG: NB-ARC domain-containing protein [Pleurocapsa sp.]
MSLEQALALVDRVIYTNTGKHLSDLQQAIIIQVWQGKKYLEIADEYGCTEGHAKDTGYLLWKFLSQAWGKKVTKNNFKSLINRQLALAETAFLANDNNLIGGEVSQSELVNFLGRKGAISYLQNLQQGEKIIVIQGEGGVGKTTLAQYFLAHQNFDLVLEVLMAKETSNIISVQSIIEEWLTRDFNEESGKELGVSLGRLKRALSNQKVGILIDNLEPALDKDGKFVTEHRNYIELLRILADRNVQSLTIITSRDRLCEADLNCQHYRLPGLDLTAWLDFFARRSLKVIPSTVAKIHQTYGGNAKAMGIICGAIAEDYRGNVDSYWQENSHDPLIEMDLKNLVASQVDRLHNLDIRAYNLLCRLGCYRYQDIPTIPRSSLLCLLWDVESKHRRRVIESLRNRSLIEFADGQYWLHPVIQAEARSRLSLVESQWQQTHQIIAEFWTESVARINNIQDGLTALEAYYHYIAIANFEEAAKVILYSRDNQWGQYLTLGTTLYRLGLLQPVLNAILEIIPHVVNPRYRSELNNILGDLYWITGQVHNAIALQQQTIITARKCLKSIDKEETTEHHLYYWRMLEIDSLLSIGLYQIDLWQLSEAADFFQQVINLANGTKHHSWSEKAVICLAFVNSYLNLFTEINNITDSIYNSIIKQPDSEYNTGRFAYFIQIMGQTFLNLGKIASARIMFDKAIAFSQASHYTQIKAKSLTGLAIIARYEHNFNTAIDYHYRAIELLDKIGAKCDLAEAYYQLGITLKDNRQVGESKKYFSSAIALFRQMKAPKQIEKVLSIAEKF